MKLTKLLWFSLLGLSLLFLYFVLAPKSKNGNEEEKDSDKSIAFYISRLVAQRKSKDVFFRTNADSPLENKSTFAG